MNFSHVSLTQVGTTVSGKYHDWGVTYANPEQAGTITGTVSLQTFTGTFQDNAGDPAGTVTWTLNANGMITNGSYSYGTTSYPWCGVPGGQGVPLPVGCGWSDAFNLNLVSSVELAQVADEVTGRWYYGPMAGIVSDHRLNGAVVCTFGGCAPGTLHRFSYQMSLDGTTFSGNYVQWNGSGYYNPECGGRVSTGNSLPATCMGGGGSYDGTWFTNVGTVTLTQPVQPSSGTPSSIVTGIWFPWGGPNPVEYPLDGGTATAETGYTLYTALPGQTHLTWTDSSPLGGAGDLFAAPNDSVGLTLEGEAANGDLWCGVDYGPDPFSSTPYANSAPFAWNTDPIGSLFPGCGLTGKQWTVWPPAPGGAGSPAAVGQLLQRRAAVTGTTDLVGVNNVVGTVAFIAPDGGSGSCTVVVGSWSDSAAQDGGTFSWYPDSQDQTFTGDFTIGSATDGGVYAWCGNWIGATQPSPCLQ